MHTASSETRPIRKFLTAAWRDVVMLNYEIDPVLLARFVPARTELDQWQGRNFVSLVGFCFQDTKVFGVPIPLHRTFDEINLRFYVRRREGKEWKRGVVFIREIVPRIAVAAVARLVYNERYVSRSMSHRIEHSDGRLQVEYSWSGGRDRGRLRAAACGSPALPEEGSQEQFIAEHYWGYAAQRDGRCLEYRVDHPSWRVWRARDASFDGDVEHLYGQEFSTALACRPASAFIAEGSSVTVFRGAIFGGTEPERE